jgi:hypothetical protein
MIGAVGSFGVSSYGAYGTQGLGVQGASDLSLTQFNPVRLRNPNVQKEVHGFEIQLHLIPGIYKWIADRIKNKYGIDVFNSDIPFTEEELKLIYHTLADIPPGHLTGVKMIVKNRSMQLNLQDAPSTVFAKTFKQNVLGAYDKENKRIYLFEMESKDQLPTVLKHEIGHAVHSYNMTYEDFFAFALRSGWNVAYHEQQYIPGNTLYNLGMRKIVLSKEEALDVMAHFDWESIRHNKDRLNKYIFSAPEGRQGNPAYKNPYETFACMYEKTH